MKRIIIPIVTLFSAVILLSSCVGEGTEMDLDYNGTYDVTYCLKSVLEYDSVNVGGINVYPYFDFFKSFRFTIHFVDEKISSVNLNNGDIPVSPYSFSLSEGDVDCYLETSVVPYELRVKSSGDVLAYYLRGEFYIPFQLDCDEISYEYRFSPVK